MDHLAVSPAELGLALIAAAAIAVLAMRRQLLAGDGAVAATVLGPALVAAGGWWLGALLIAFFLSSSLLPSADGDRPARTARQVIANGGPALAFGASGVISGEAAVLTGAAATIAAAASDTWGTELGKAFGGPPISIRTGRRVPPGTSGAVSLVGTAASVAGAILIAGLAWLLAPIAPDLAVVDARQIAGVAAGGVLGSVVDSIVGATVQARFRCERCGRLAETPGEHRPGHAMRHASGIPWLTNSVVNVIAITVAGSAGVWLGMLGG